MSRKDEDYQMILFEEMREQNKRILEALAAMADLPAKVDKLAEDMVDVKTDIKVIKAVVTAQSRHLHDHERRITVLEAA